MPENNDNEPKDEQPHTADCPLEPRGDEVVSDRPTPPRAGKGKRIHPRRSAPPVPELDEE